MKVFIGGAWPHLPSRAKAVILQGDYSRGRR